MRRLGELADKSRRNFPIEVTPMARHRQQVYAAIAERSGDWWAITVPEVPGLFTQARRLTGAEAMARDAIATMLGVPPHTVHVRVEPRLGDDLDRQAAEAR